MLHSRTLVTEEAPAIRLYPPLTTVRQDFGRLGEISMQKVLIAVEEPDSATEDTPPADSSGGSAVDEVRP